MVVPGEWQWPAGIVPRRDARKPGRHRAQLTGEDVLPGCRRQSAEEDLQTHQEVRFESQVQGTLKVYTE